MEFLSERVAYLKGLAEGMKIEESTNEGKLLKNIIDVLEDFSEVIMDIEDSQIELSEHIEEIDEDLADLESEVYEDEYDYDYNDDDDFFEGEDETNYFEIECPNCHQTVYLDENVFEGDEELQCPNCKEPIVIEFDCGCDCDCEHHEE